MSKWSKDSWKNFKIKHIPQYNDPDQLEKALKKLEGFPPLVFAGECRNLKQDLHQHTLYGLEIERALLIVHM